MQKPSHSFSVIGLAGFGESGVNYFFEHQIYSAKYLVFNERNNLYTPDNIIQITMPHFIHTEYFEKLFTSLIEIISPDKEVFLLLGGAGRLGNDFAEILLSRLSLLGFKIVVLISSPFSWEGEQRKQKAEELISKIEPFAHSVFKYDNEKMKQSINRDKPAIEAYHLVFEEYCLLLNTFNLFHSTEEEVQIFLINQHAILEMI